VSTVATPRRAATALPRRTTTLADRVLAAVPLASIYLWLSIVYSVEAWKRVTPWLFTDELELTQLSRSIADTGHAARRGEPHSFRSLYAIMIAPLWLIHDVAKAYSAIKYADVLVMTSVVFPTYYLARMVVRKPWALFAATGAAAIPSLAYSSWIIEEPLAYPYAALCFLLIAKALVHKSRGWIAGALVASALAPAVRGELVVVPIALGLALLFALWSSDWAKTRRASWSVGAYLGCIALVAGAIIVLSGYLSWHSTQWLEVTSYNWTKKRIFLYGDWAAGSLATGLGVIPLVVGLAALVPVHGEERSRELRMVRAVATAAIISFGLYTAMKAAYLSMVFASRTEERNLIYIAPLLFVGTALAFDRRRVNLAALAAAAAYGFYLVVGTPYWMDRQLYSDALGVAILEQANRFYEWGPGGAQWLMIAILLGGVALLGVAVILRRRAVAVVVTAALAVGILAWNVTGEIAASAGTISISHDLESTLRHPFTWVDSATHLKPTLYLGQGVADQDPEWELEFWNRSIVTVSSLDGTLQGPGPAGAPNITNRGKLYWTVNPADIGRLYAYAVEDWPCVDFAGTLVRTHRYLGGAAQLKEWRLIRLTKPNRLRAYCTGIYPDGWSNAQDSEYLRFASSKPGWLRITISRENWPATPVDIQFGRIAVAYHTPMLGKITRQQRFEVKSGENKVVWLRTPAKPFAARILVEKKFSPHAMDPRSGDVRTLGAQVSYEYFSKKPKKRR
jgi:hypothetical protein